MDNDANDVMDVVSSTLGALPLPPPPPPPSLPLQPYQLPHPPHPWHHKWTTEVELTECLFAGLIDDRVIGKECARTDDMLDPVYGDTDSVMHAVPLRTLKNLPRAQIIAFAQFVSDTCCELVNTYLKDLELLQAEKISERTLMPGVKKNYIMHLTTGATIYSGIDGKKRDAHPLVTKFGKLLHGYMMDPCTPLDELEDCIGKMLQETREILSDLPKGRVRHSQMILAKKLSRAVYKNTTEATVVRDKKLARREEVNVGDRLKFVLIDMDPNTPEGRLQIREQRGMRSSAKRNVDMAEDAQYAIQNGIPLNYEEMFYRKIYEPLLKLYRPLIVPITNFPNSEHLVREGLAPDSNAGKKLLEKRREAVFKYQNKRTAPLIFKAVMDDFTKRRQVRYRNIEYEDTFDETKKGTAGEPPHKKAKTLTSFFTLQTSIRVSQRICTHCNTIFSGERDICAPCYTGLDAIAQETYTTYTENKIKLAKTYERCRLCVADTGFPELDPDKCTDFVCPVYEERFSLKSDMSAAKTKIMTFQEQKLITRADFEW